MSRGRPRIARYAAAVAGERPESTVTALFIRHHHGLCALAGGGRGRGGDGSRERG